MSKLFRVKFKPEHAHKIQLREQEVDLINREWIINMAKHGTLVTFVMEEKIIAIIGYFEKWNGVIKVFVIPSVYVPECAKSFFKAVKEGIDRLYNDFHYHRLETESNADDQTDSWMKHLGFKCEGTMEKFSAKQGDYRMWSRVK